jgi:hypothetical protein
MQIFWSCIIWRISHRLAATLRNHWYDKRLHLSKKKLRANYAITNISEKLILKTESAVWRCTQQKKHKGFLGLKLGLVWMSGVSMHIGLFLLSMDTFSLHFLYSFEAYSLLSRQRWFQILPMKFTNAVILQQTLFILKHDPMLSNRWPTTTLLEQNVITSEWLLSNYSVKLYLWTQ